jgi:hypothetical protein
MATFGTRKCKYRNSVNKTVLSRSVAVKSPFIRRIEMKVNMNLFVGSIVLVTLLYFSYPTVGQETASTNEKSEAVQDVELEAVDSKPATTIDFAGELGADFPSLLTLGSRIDVAKRDNDPVTLALLGQELKAAETVAGKTASLSSTKIFDDAAKLAIERAHTNELKAVKFLIPDKAADLDKAIVLASEDDVSRQGGRSNPQFDRGRPHPPQPTPQHRQGSVTVRNNSDQMVRVSIEGGNGGGTVRPHGSERFNVRFQGDRHVRVTVTGRGNTQSATVSPRNPNTSVVFHGGHHSGGSGFQGGGRH